VFEQVRLPVLAGYHDTVDDAVLTSWDHSTADPENQPV
jgi:hypothetical protein